jgi:lysophospholipase L1-like esterase
MTGPGLYAALGDSISIDDYSGGPGRGGASLLFRNQDDDFPDWRGRDLVSADPDARLALLATDGATVDTLERSQLRRLAALDRRPTLVTLTVGGNDVLSCFGDTPAARQTVREVAERVSAVLAELATLLAPGGRVVVGTVYDPSDGTADADRLGLPPWPEAVDVLQELNDELRRVAGSAGAAVADIAATFLGHGLQAGDPNQPDPRPGSRELWFCSLIEPNAWGASGVREAFWTALHR